MKAFARVANFATVQLETGKGGWQFMQHQRAFEWQEESGSTLNHQQMPTPGRVPGTRQNICKFRPLSQIYEVRDHPLNSVPLTCICQDQKKPSPMILFVSVGSCEYTIRVLGKDGDQEKPATNRLISFDLCFVSSVNS